MHASSVTRREALKTATIAALALPLLRGGGAQAAEVAAGAAPVSSKRSRLKLGVASYSLAKLPVPEVIAVLKQLQIESVSLYKSHAPWSDGTPEQCRTVAQTFRDAGIAVTSTGMIELPNDEAALRKSFDNVRAAGLNTFCGWLKTTDSLPLVDKLVKEYDLRIAVHNHGPTQALATGMEVWKAVQPYDARIGLCLDIGHGFRAGEDPAETVRVAKSRLYQVHLRDTGVRGGEMKDPDPVVVGRGLVDLPAVVAALLEVNFSAYADFEYEKKEDNRVPGLAESIGYVRGVTAALLRSA